MADKTLLVKNCGDNVSGVYQPGSTDDQGKPTWKRKDGGTSSPLDVPQWGRSGKPCVVAMKEIDTSECPKMVLIESNCDNLYGGYVRLDDDFDGYPAYKNKEDGTVLFYRVEDDMWVLSNSLGNTSYFNSCKTDKVDVTQLQKSMWKEPESITEIREITWKNLPNDTGFLDQKFPADFAALGAEWSKNHPTYHSPDTVEWIRATRLNRDNPQDLFGQIRPRDIGQGMVGDCWLISAISCLAQFPGAVQAVFSRHGLSENGRYDLKFFDIRTDQWKTVTVDDLLPCHKREFYEFYAKTLFAKSSGDYVWPMIVEKAFAKFIGSYGNLCGGQAAFAWQALTGCSKQYHYSLESGTSWTVYELDVVEQKKQIQADRRACPFKGGSHRLSADEMWKVILESDRSNYVMGATIQPKTDEVEHRRDCGLVEGHAYSLISAVETGGFRFVKLRNPWGQFEWKGAWSDDWNGWESYSEIREELQVDTLAEGMFYMEWKDFSSNYNGVSISAMSMATSRSNGHVDMGNTEGSGTCEDGNVGCTLNSHSPKRIANVKPIGNFGKAALASKDQPKRSPIAKVSPKTLRFCDERQPEKNPTIPLSRWPDSTAPSGSPFPGLAMPRTVARKWNAESGTQTTPRVVSSRASVYVKNSMLKRIADSGTQTTPRSPRLATPRGVTTPRTERLRVMSSTLKRNAQRLAAFREQQTREATSKCNASVIQMLQIE